jgi:adenylosuccinate synthase
LVAQEVYYQNEADLQDNAKRYISFIEESIGVPIIYPQIHNVKQLSRDKKNRCWCKNPAAVFYL